MSLVEPPSFVRFEPPPTKPDGVPHVTVAIGAGALGPCGHVGVFYRSGDSTRFLHLAWHHQLRSEEPPKGFGWIVSPLPAERAMQVAARCRKIVRANPRGLPYAPGRFAGFDSHGVLQLQEGTFGFTCATFVLAVFAHADLPLAVPESWPARPEDEPFRNTIAEMLAKDLAKLRRKRTILELEQNREIQELRDEEQRLEAHIASLRAMHASARFRPEEVAAASSLEERPARFEQVTEPARRIAEHFASRAH